MTNDPLISPILASALIVILPLLAFLIQAILGKRSTSGIFSIAAIALSTILSIYVFFTIWDRGQVSMTWEWFHIGDKTFTVGILLNNLTVLMHLLVCVIALPVHIYSISYMRSDPAIHRYWMFMSLFCFAMLGLVISKNLLMLFIFWEMMGLASYLLIGFWFTKSTASAASQKAFVINRIGDIGFVVGIGLVFSQFGTIDLTELFGGNSSLYPVLANPNNDDIMTATGIAFLIAAMAKSAQFPFHIWLPDAMEGPTAVSALIHAATMVAAGIFLLTSLFPLFNTTVLSIITIVGCVTALTGSVFALVQYDIKKILAFSTISQLGFMVVAIGLGAWDAAIFHLVTHAFFKCLLFLSAGGIIHQMQDLSKGVDANFDPQDIRNMGGLKKYMPRTFWLMALSAVALSGFPLTSGFLSKDAIVISASEWAIAEGGINYVVPSILLIASFLTGLYIGRLIIKVFFGRFRAQRFMSVSRIVRDIDLSMFIPMLLLGFCSLFALFSLNPFAYQEALVLRGFAVRQSFASIPALHVLIPAILTIATAVSWLVAWQWYFDQKNPLNAQGKLIQFCFNGGYIDQIVQKVFVRKILRFSLGINWFDRHVVDGIVNGSVGFMKTASVLAVWIDRHIVDGIVNGSAIFTMRVGKISAWVDRYIVDGLVNTVARATYALGDVLRWIQNGRLQNYLAFVFAMILIGLLYFVIL